MAEISVKKSSFFKEKKEEPNTDFSCERCINGKYKSVREINE